jgi:hypothetical protein
MAKFDPFAVPAGYFTMIANAAYSHQSAQNYCASLLPSDKRGVPLVLLNPTTANKECDLQPLASANLITTANNEQLFYVIERLCTDTGTPDQTKCPLTRSSRPAARSARAPTSATRCRCMRDGAHDDRVTRGISAVIFRL